MGKASRSKRRILSSVDGTLHGVESQGFSFKANPRTELPQPGDASPKHHWIAIATYNVTAENALAAYSGQQVHLDMENLSAIMVGCFKCETAFTPEVAHTTCSGWRPPIDELIERSSLGDAWVWCPMCNKQVARDPSNENWCIEGHWLGV